VARYSKGGSRHEQAICEVIYDTIYFRGFEGLRFYELRYFIPHSLGQDFGVRWMISTQEAENGVDDIDRYGSRIFGWSLCRNRRIGEHACISLGQGPTQYFGYAITGSRG